MKIHKMTSYKSYGTNAHIVLVCQPETEIIVSIFNPELMPHAVNGWNTVNCNLCLKNRHTKKVGTK